MSLLTMVKNKVLDCWRTYFCCSLKAAGFIIGWISVTYRVVASVAVSVVLSKLTKYDPAIYTILLSIFLAYCLMSLAADLLLIIGISQNKPNFLLPYLSMNGIEIFALAITLIGGSIFFEELASPSVLSYLLPSGILVIAIDAACWVCLAKLFKQLQKLLYEDEDPNHSRGDCGCDVFWFKLPCGNSATIDIETEH